MKVGIVGYRGFVGSALYGAFCADKKYEAVGIDRDNAHLMKGSMFDILVNANGNSSKRLADADPQRDLEMNVAATIGFLTSIACVRYVHISTVEVYNDKSSAKSTDEDAKIDPASLSNYGFSKYCGELAARKYAKSCMVLRLAGMVGPGMKKGPAYDILSHGRIYLSEKSRLPFMDTREVARIAKLLCERGKWGETYNVVGRGSVQLSEFAKIARIRLSSAGKEEAIFRISTGKLECETGVMASEEAVRRFVGEWKGRK
jgi:nucleoside-diphosphate-sugar epimerase